MANLVVLEHHLWLNLTETNGADRMALLDSPVSPLGLFGSIADGFEEYYIEAQKSS